MPRLAGKTALITGAGTGIGRAIALAMAREGAQIALAARRREPIESVAAEIVSAGGAAVLSNVMLLATLLSSLRLLLR